MHDDEMRYHTGFDAGMGVVIGLAIAPSFVIGAVEPKARTTMLVVGASLLLLFWYLYRTTHYTFEAQALRVQCGPFRFAIPYDAVRGASPSASLMSGYAMSLQRIEVEYGKFDSVLISPADRTGFLDELRRRAPHANIRQAD
jgi:hypothetical protein